MIDGDEGPRIPLWQAALLAAVIIGGGLFYAGLTWAIERLGGAL